MDPPPKRSLIKALEELFALGALDIKGNLSITGNLMSEFPVDPQISKSIISAIEYNCANEIIIIMSMLSVQRDLFYFPPDRKAQAEACRKSFFTSNGDHIMLLNIWNKVLFCQIPFLILSVKNQTSLILGVILISFK